MPLDREGAPQAGGKRKNAEPRAMCPPMSATELAAADNVPPMCQRAAKLMREVTEATNCFEDEVEADYA